MNDNPKVDPVSFDEFQKLVAAQLQLDLSKVTPGAAFIDDLMVDSIQLVDMLLSLEELGIQIPLEAAWDLRTVGDAYRVYAGRAES